MRSEFVHSTLPEIKVALAGNPNSGKTTLFNDLVGANQKVGNFSGVTVQKIEGSLKHKGYRIRFVDLPGTHSLSAYSPEEIVTRNFIIEEKPDLVLNIIDGTNLEKNFYLTVQLMELGSNLLVAINMFDEVEKAGTDIHIKQLQELIGCPIIPVSAKKKKGISDVLDNIIDIYSGNTHISKEKISFRNELEIRIDHLSKLISTDTVLARNYNTKWLAIKLYERDEIIFQLLKERPIWLKIFKYLMDSSAYIEKRFENDIEFTMTEDRHAFIKGALKETVKYKKHRSENFTDKLDKILINRILGIPVFLFIMWLIFQFVFRIGEYPMHWLEVFFGWLGNIAGMTIENETIRSLVVDGIIAGVGGVLVFLPNILLLFFALAFFEGSGYMARAAFVVDKVMHIFGLHGKSAISMITGFGCSVPAFMSTRTLKSKSDRITTMLIIPFMSCGAKLPVYILLIGAFFHPAAAANVLFGIYIFGVIIALFSALLFKSTIFKGKSEPFVMELPPYRMPSGQSMLFQMWRHAAEYLKKAGTIILIASVLIWLGSNYPQNKKITDNFEKERTVLKEDKSIPEEHRMMQMEMLNKKEASQQIRHSLVGNLGMAVEPVIKPLGFDWRIGISLITGIIGKEVVVSTMSTLYALGENDPGNIASLQKKLKEEPEYDLAMAIALLIFVLLYVPCIAASIVFHREAGAWKYTFVYITYSIGIAWLLAFAGYHITLLFL